MSERDKKPGAAAGEDRDNAEHEAPERKAEPEATSGEAKDAGDTATKEPEAAQNAPAEPAPGEAKPAEPERRAQAPAAAAPAAEPAPRGGRGALVLAVIALLLALAAGLGAYFLWENLSVMQRELQAQQAQGLEAARQELEGAIEERGGALEQRLGEQTGAMQQTVEAIEKQQAALAKDQDALTSRQEDLQRTLRTTLERMGQRHEGWLVEEAAYLLRIAAHRVELARDPQTASSALEAADMRLRETGDSAFVPVRQAIADQLRALDTVEQPDVTGISVKLGSLVRSVDELPLRGGFKRPEPGQATDPAEREPVDLTTADGWRDLAGQLWADIRGLVTFRRDGAAGQQPLLPPEQQYYLRQNLRLQLEQAQLALLRGEPTVYKQSLEQARAWAQEYFVEDSAAVASLLEDVQALAEQPVRAELPDISEPVRVLREVRANLRRGGGEQ